MSDKRTKRLEDINGQQSAIDAVLATWDREPANAIFLVIGPPGAGVTWALHQCGKSWEAIGGAALEARGEEFAADRRLFPWLTMALPGAQRSARLEILKGGLAQGSRAVPVVGSVTSYLVEEVLNHRKRLLKRQALLLTEQEQDLLFVIQATADKKRLLLVIDHIDVWDDASWSLLTLILSDRLHELYPALKNAIVVVGVSREVPDRLNSALSRLVTREHRIELLDLEQMSAAVSVFELPAMSQDGIGLLFQITNGRLDLLHDVAQHLRETDLFALTGSWTELYSKLIGRRVRALREHAKDLTATLTAAAVIGRAFGLNDIACLVGGTATSVATMLRLAAAERLITSLGDMARFDSAELHQYFHRAGSSEHIQYHSKFAECLRVMRPGDYGHRVHHLLRAGNTEQAQTCHALAVLSARRQYRAAPDPGDLASSAGWPEVSGYLDRMREAFDAYDGQRIAEGLEIIQTIEAFLPETLIAEKDYLEALLLLSTSSMTNYNRARGLLERWRLLAGREAELWGRIAQTLIVVYAQISQLEEARQLEAGLTADYWARRQVDPWALYALNVLRRRAECLHSLPTATARLESALAYFGPSGGDSIPRHPIQYYYALTNLVGNKLASGQFHEACENALALEELIRRHPTLPWPAPEIPANNSVVARHLAGSLNADSATELLMKVAQGSTESGDRLLLQNNYAVLAIRAGRVSEARAVLEAALVSIVSGNEPDGYHRYFISNNLSGLVAIEGDLPRALRLVDDCASVLDQFYPAVHATMVRRQPMLKQLVTEAPQLTTAEFDDGLIQRHGMQVGPQWAFYGRGFLLTDIQFWSAD